MPNQEPFTNASDAELANAVQENLFALFRTMVKTLPEVNWLKAVNSVIT
jgi:flagellin-specific chaperone FliS